MALQVMRVNFFFTDIRGKGWSETYFNLGTDYNNVMADAKYLADTRRQLSGQGVFLEEIRVSDDSVKRDSLVYALPTSDQQSQYVSSGGDIASTVLMLRAEAGFQNHRPIYLSGIPDIFTIDNGIFNGSATWYANYQAYKAALIGRNWAIKAIITNQPPNVNVFKINLVSQNLATGKVLVQTVLPHNFSPGDVVNITGTRGSKALRGRHVCGDLTIPATTNFDFPSKVILGNPSPLGFVQKVDFAKRQITGVTILRMTHRIRGLPFDKSRGRRLA